MKKRLFASMASAVIITLAAMEVRHLLIATFPDFYNSTRQLQMNWQHLIIPWTALFGYSVHETYKSIWKKVFPRD